MILLGLQEVLYWEEISLLKETISRFMEEYKPNAQSHEAYEKARDTFYKTTICGKEDFLRRIENYKRNGKPIWVSGRNEYWDDISFDRLERAFCYVSEERGQDLANRPRGKWAGLYAEKVLGDTPQKILELTVGAGGGTGAVAGKMRKEDRMIGVDIDFVCAKNADGIGRHFGVSLLGMCCSLWSLPFPDESFSVICSQRGLHECREIPAILLEAARVLIPGGRIVLTLGENGYQMYKGLFELFDIGEEEGLKCLKDARLYSTLEDVDYILRSSGVVRIDYQSLETGGCLVEYEKKK